jgi:hypothetical protein
MLAICPFCECEDDHPAVSGRRGPGAAWIRLECVKCDEGFEEYVADENCEDCDDGQTRKAGRK